MAGGVDLTFQVLKATQNQAANGLLTAAFKSSNEDIRKVAGITLMSRKGGSGIDTIINDFDPDDEFLVGLIRDNRSKMIPGLRTAVVGSDTMLAKQAFRIAYSQSIYEVLPSMFAYCFGPGSQDKNFVHRQNEMLKFCDRYIEALERKESHERHLLVHTIFPELVKTIRTKVKEFRHDANELTLKVFLRFYPFFSDVESELKQVLRIASTPVYLAAYRRLLSDNDVYLFQFIARCLDRFNPPPLILQVIATRFDMQFLPFIFRQIKEPLPMEIQTNLGNLPPVEWLEQIGAVFDKLDGEALQGFVTFLQYLPMSDADMEAYLLRVFYHGQGVGRIAAFNALKPMKNEKTDRLVWDAAGDTDPDIQVEALTELTSRNLPGMSSRIIQFASTPNVRVRETIQKLLPNFKLVWFMEVFDKLDDERRRKMFDVVRHLDERIGEKLSIMLEAGDEVAKQRALVCLDYCSDLVQQSEKALCWLLQNGDLREFRLKCAELLINGKTDESRSALVQAFHRDSDADIRNAAKMSLENRPVSLAKT
ncbi:MAG: hypothetical protein LBT89_09695 [Planctomycetaceae bacterium]|jgi:hypothetical protein|nr:hypothetical protein [Planctomycetaceae bacterium]